ncbi:MAG TPA: ribonuclease R [bacterium]|nr:ribonuclease R [bacterium]
MPPEKHDWDRRITDYLFAHSGQTFRSRELARKLKVPDSAYRRFKKTVDELRREGRIRRFKGGRVGHLQPVSSVTGVLEVKTGGYGFLRRDDEKEDVFIGRRRMESAVHGDRVRVEILSAAPGRLSEGQVTEVLERRHERIVGTYAETEKGGILIPDNLKIRRDIEVRPTHNAGARPGQKVVGEILFWGEENQRSRARITRILGFPREPGVDILSLIHARSIAEDFPQAVLKEAAALSQKIPETMLTGRLDLRGLPVLTIDPEDAADFDDAVSLEYMENGRMRLGVHIADVSAYVKPGSAMDEEAMRRGTSIYLVDRVIPMLPPRVSSDLCSLKPGEDRLTLSVMMTLDSEANLEEYTFHETCIQSRWRLTYEEAQRYLEDTPDAGAETGVRSGRGPRPMLRDLHAISLKLKERWLQQGAVEFESPEPEVILNERGDPVSCRIRPRLPAHGLIESLMLLTNKTVAEAMHEITAANRRPFIYRIHERPKGEKLEAFSRLVNGLGYRFDPGKRVTSRAFQKLLRRVKDTPYYVIIEDVALRSMMKAVYTIRPGAHFGLAFRHYTHFTSPIRRYPDLMVHRLIKTRHHEAGRYSRKELGQICDHATSKEIQAQEAERESIRLKQLIFMSERVGESYEGVVSGVTNFGVFVEIVEMMVEGMIPLRVLDDDYYEFQESRYTLKGRRTGRVIRLGDRVRVRVLRVNAEEGKMDFMLVQEGE